MTTMTDAEIIASHMRGDILSREDAGRLIALARIGAKADDVRTTYVKFEKKVLDRLQQEIAAFKTGCVMTDPIERIVATALDAAGIAYTTEGHNAQRLDFYLPAFYTFIEVKQLHSPRIVAQMASADNVIAIQGRGAAEAFAAMLTRPAFNQPHTARLARG